MDYLSVVRFLHPGPARSNLRPVFAALASCIVVVTAACGNAGPDGPSLTPAPTPAEVERPTTVAPTAPPASSPGPFPAPFTEPTATAATGPASTSTALATTTPVGQGPSSETPLPAADPSRPVTTDVSWPRGDVFVGGTLIRPTGAAAGDALPAVLLVADGGGADRDWVSPSIPGINGSGRLFAVAIAAEGYVTLRYDRRGTGRRFAETAPPPGENRLDDLVDEVSRAIDFLASRPEVDPDRIFVVAHDEGALYVLLGEQGSEEPALAGIALLAPSGLTLRQQVIRRLGELTTGPQDEPLLGRFDAAMAFFIEGTLLPDEDLGFSPSLQALFDNLSHPLNQPYVSEVWNLDVVSLLPGTRPPVLVLIGRADSESDWIVDGGKWEDVVAVGQDVQFAYPANADHVLKSVSPGNESGDAIEDAETGIVTYNVFGRTLDEETVAVLLDWLNERSGLFAP